MLGLMKMPSSLKLLTLLLMLVTTCYSFTIREDDAEYVGTDYDVDGDHEDGDGEWIEELPESVLGATPRSGVTRTSNQTSARPTAGLVQSGMGTDVTEVRLSGSRRSHEGRVEVRHNGVWGTVCDDGFKSTACGVICKQLGLSATGTCMNEDGGLECRRANYTDVSTGRIWIDELLCLGFEENIDECQHNNWGSNNCAHKEDAGCTCHVELLNLDLPEKGDVVIESGTCDRSRHRIQPFDAAVPSSGRVEIQLDNGTWGLVCDDVWNDLGARVFCSCLGYKEYRYFRAVLYPHHMTSLPVLYDAISCSRNDSRSKRNLWQCSSVRPAVPGKCDPTTEAAGVTCEKLSTGSTSTRSQGEEGRLTDPTADGRCNSTTLVACINSSMSAGTELTPDHFALVPSDCHNASKRLMNDSDGRCTQFCYDIDLRHCPTEIKQMYTDHDLYCYDIMYYAYKSDPYRLLTGNMIDLRYRMCCKVPRSGQAVATFTVSQRSIVKPVHTSVKHLQFSLACYRDETFSGSRLPLEQSVVVTRGDELYCKISVDSWDREHMLVVNNCYFAPYENASDSIVYFFIRNKCSQTDALGILFYSGSHHSWGMRFAVPKFQGFDTLLLTCEAFVCNRDVDDKANCDRSCTTDNNSTAVFNNTRTNTIGDTLSLSDSLSNGAVTSRSAVTTGTSATTAATTRPVRRRIGRHLRLREKPVAELITSGEFGVNDPGFGPLIDESGHLYVVPRPENSRRAVRTDVSSCCRLESLSTAATCLLSVLLLTVRSLTHSH